MWMEDTSTIADVPEAEVLPEIGERNGSAATSPETAPPATSLGTPEKPYIADDDMPPLKKRRLRRIIIPVILLLAAAAAAYYFFRIREQPETQISNEYTYFTVGRRDITSSLSGSGTLQPADSYSVTALVSGEILVADFEEGDIVDEDTILYEIDSSDARTSIEQAENSLEQSRRNHNQRVQSLGNLQIQANGSGTIVSMNVDVGDTVSAGQLIASIRDSSIMTLSVPFSTDDADRLSIGQTAEVVLDGTFERLNGVIARISPIEELLSGNMIVRMVTIDVINPGGISLSHIATASVGDIFSNGYGSFDYKENTTVTASASGDVVAVYANEGDYVQRNSTIVRLSSDSLSNDIANSEYALRNEELSLSNRYKQLDDYTITSPISGTIVEKNYKQGDNLDAGRTLCIIYDLSYMTMTLNVDELDISDVQVGQDVTVTAEALGDRIFRGVVTRININGTTINGVTSYPVTIRIDDTDGLLPGMNVQAEIVVSNSSDVLAIPVSALSRGNRVLVKTSGDPDRSGNENMPQFNGEGMPQFDRENMPQFDGEGAQQFDRENMPQPGGEVMMQRPVDGSVRQSFGRPQQGTGQSSADMTVSGQSGLPEGYHYVVVTTGVSDDNYIEITSGLSEGDEIAYIPDTSQADFFMSDMVFYESRAVTGGPMPAGGGVRIG